MLLRASNLIQQPLGKPDRIHRQLTHTPRTFSHKEPRLRRSKRNRPNRAHSDSKYLPLIRIQPRRYIHGYHGCLPCIHPFNQLLHWSPHLTPNSRP